MTTLATAYGGTPPLYAPQGKIFFAKSTGLAGNSGKDPSKAATLAQAYALATADKNDVIYLLSESNTSASTTTYLTANLEWAKDLTHLIGVGAGSAFSQRSRIAWASTASASVDTVMFTHSADCCRVENIAFFCGIADANLSFDVLVSGTRNVFKNCHFGGIGHTTNDATDAYSLKVSGDENLFEDCVIGLDTIVRAGANNELWITGNRNIFRRCTILSYSVTSGRCPVRSDTATGWNLFEDCRFICWTPNLATGSTNVFDMPAAASSGNVYLVGCAAFGGGAAGIGSAWSDVDTNIFNASPAGAATGGKSAAAN